MDGKLNGQCGNQDLMHTILLYKQCKQEKHNNLPFGLDLQDKLDINPRVLLATADSVSANQQPTNGTNQHNHCILQVSRQDQ